MKKHPAVSRSPVRQGARQRRLEIIEATLQVMRRDGLRAVSHRAVAAEAGVPLAATTYYFRDLEDLITESFLHWSVAQRQVVENFHRGTLQMLNAAFAAGVDRAELAARLADAVTDYVAEQVGTYRGDRVLEFAFLHEAVRLPRLRDVVVRQQHDLAGFLAEFHAALGSTLPEVDAKISYSLLVGLEKGAMLAGSSAIDRAGIRAVLLRYLGSALGVLEASGGAADATATGGSRGTVDAGRARPIVVKRTKRGPARRESLSGAG